MSTLAEIESAADQLPAEELAKLLAHITANLERTSQPTPPQRRIAGLHPGAMEMAPDFDAPLQLG